MNVCVCVCVESQNGFFCGSGRQHIHTHKPCYRMHVDQGWHFVFCVFSPQFLLNLISIIIPLFYVPNVEVGQSMVQIAQQYFQMTVV